MFVFRTLRSGEKFFTAAAPIYCWKNHIFIYHDKKDTNPDFIDHPLDGLWQGR